PRGELRQAPADGGTDLRDLRRGTHRPQPLSAARAPPPTRSSHSCGSVSSAGSGRVSGEVHTRLNTAMPASRTTVWTKRDPWAYCFIFRSIPRIRRRDCSTRPAPDLRALNRDLIWATVGTTCGPTASIT